MKRNQCKNNKQLFIIGNGFDRAHNLETSYQDFYYYLSRSDATVDEKCLLNFLIDKISLHSEDSDVIWSNFEGLLGNAYFDADIEMTSEYDMDQSDDEADKDADYYDYQVIGHLQEEQYIAESLPSIFARWISNIDVTVAKKNEKFKKLIQDTDEFLTFNYTRTLEKIYDVSSPCHIHGTIDVNGEEDKILVGHGHDNLESYTYSIGDKNPLADLSSLDAIEECKNMARSMYNAWKKDVQGNLETHKYFFRRLHDVRTIHSYGFSYGLIDIPYIQAIIDNLKESGKVCWFLEDYNEDANTIYEEKIREAGFNGTIGRFSVKDEQLV